MPKSNVIPSGIEPLHSERELLDLLAKIEHLFHDCATEALRRLQDAEAKCLERLTEYVPTNRPLTVEEAAAYLGMTKRALNDGTRPGKNPVVPFLIINGKKLFRLSSLDKELERREIKRAEVRL